MHVWRARGVELLLAASVRPLTAEEREELIAACREAASCHCR